MRVLLDNNVNQRFANLLTGHHVVSARSQGWAELFNGDLISAAEREGFDVLITADKQMQYQQNVSSRRLTILILNSLFIRLGDIAPLAPKVQAGLDSSPDSGAFLVINP